MRLLIYKSRVEPSQLTVLKNLKSRMILTKNDQQKLYTLSKGYEGELKFDAYLLNLKCDCLVLNDLLLSINNQIFQIDTLLILNDQIFLFEIKNYSGDFYYDSNRFFQKDGTEISNPLIQLQRTESLLRQLLLKNNFKISIYSSVVFINSEFSLYQAPLDIPFILPNQLNRFSKSLNTKESKLNERHKKIAEMLNNLHVKEHPSEQFPTYSYHDLQKGIKCVSCESITFSTTDYTHDMEVVCLTCENKEKLESAIMRTVREFQVLFPTEKITTSKIYEWCNIKISKKTIRRILLRNFNKQGTNRWVYYTL